MHTSNIQNFEASEGRRDIGICRGPKKRRLASGMKANEEDKLVGEKTKG